MLAHAPRSLEFGAARPVGYAGQAAPSMGRSE